MKSSFLWVLLFSLFFFLPLWAAPLNLDLHSEGAILINMKTGGIIYEKNARELFFPASTTKIATALFVLKQGGEVLDQLVTARKEALVSITPQAKKQSNYRSPPFWLETDGSHIGLKQGEEMKLRHLLYAMLISSANDASNVLALHFGRTIPAFMENLNQFLTEIGCTQTYFNNPHGLHHPAHVTSPYDLALMARKAMELPIFREIVSTVRYSCPRTNLEEERIFLQTNLLMRNGPYYYSKATGVKTGSTSAAGKNLVAAAENDQRQLIAVLLGCKGKSELYQDAARLFQAAFQEPKMRRMLLQPGPQGLTTKVRGAGRPLVTFLEQGLFYDFYPSEESPVRVMIKWSLPEVPIRKKQVVGTLYVVDDLGNILKEAPLSAAEEVPSSLWFRAWHGCAQRKRTLMGAGGIIFLVFLIRWKRKKRMKRPLYPQ